MSNKKARKKQKQIEKEQAAIEANPEGSFLQKGHNFLTQNVQKYFTKENLILIGGEVFNLFMQNTIPSQKEAISFACDLEHALYSEMPLSNIIPVSAMAFALNKITGLSNVIYDTTGITEFSNANRQIGQVITHQAINFVSAIPSNISYAVAKVKSSLCNPSVQAESAINPHRMFNGYKKEYIQSIQRDNDVDDPSNGLISSK